MATKSQSKATQIIKSQALTATGDGLFYIMRMLESGEEPRRVLSAIAEEVLAAGNATSAAIFLPGKQESQRELAAVAGDYDESLGAESDPPPEGAPRRYQFDVVCLGASIGSLVCTADQELSPIQYEKVQILAHHAGVAYERQRVSNNMQSLLDRLEVLNELNQLIASNTSLQRIVKNLARESAFRFAADVTITFLLEEDRRVLTPQGGYGCTQNMLPQRIDLSDGLLGQVMRMGGHISVPSLAAQAGHCLDFLSEMGIRSVNICCLEVRGEALGAILNGYRRENALTADDLTRFEEFSQGGAVAIANARTQERITEYTERLEQLVESRTADLAVQTARAEDANRAKSQFLANMSHELRTPLTAIVGYSSVLAEGVFGELNDKQKDALTAITRSSEHLKNLIDDVLNLARIESGKEQPEPTKVVLKDVLTQAHKLMMQTALSKGVTLQQFKLAEEFQSTCLWADAKHVHQILINLMSNAVKYTPRGGKVWVEVGIVSDKVKISVRDSGVGISPQKLKKLFERFERGEDTYSKSQEGTGIGLNLTRHLVELNGGGIGVESVEGEGSTFWVLLPLAKADSPVVNKQESHEVRTRLDGLSTLVVDDNSDTCEVLKHILISVGASVRTARTVKEGIDALRDEVPDIVLTDLAMPGESGTVLIEHIRNSPGALSHMPIIVLSACAFQSDREAALEAGASIFIPKPFKPVDVLKLVRQLTLTHALEGH